MADPSAYLPLLRMATAASAGAGAAPRASAEADPDAEPPRAMDAERVAWLRGALAESLVDPVAEMKKLLERVRAPDASDEERADALERLVGFVENVDAARDFHKIGGLALAVDLVRGSASSAVRQSAAHVLGAAVQNNPEPQTWALELGAMEALHDALLREGATHAERAKALFSLSSLVRNHDAATIKFLRDAKGLAVLLRLLAEEPHPDRLPVKRKALFLMTYLVARAPAALPSSAKAVVPVVASALEREWRDPDLRDKAVQVLEAYGANETARRDTRHVVVKSVTAVVREARGDAGGDADRDAEMEVRRITEVWVA